MAKMAQKVVNLGFRAFELILGAYLCLICIVTHLTGSCGASEHKKPIKAIVLGRFLTIFYHRGPKIDHFWKKSPKLGHFWPFLGSFLTVFLHLNPCIGIPRQTALGTYTLYLNKNF